MHVTRLRVSEFREKNERACWQILANVISSEIKELVTEVVTPIIEGRAGVRGLKN